MVFTHQPSGNPLFECQSFVYIIGFTILLSFFFALPLAFGAWPGKMPEDFQLTLESAPMDLRDQDHPGIERVSIKADGTAILSPRFINGQLQPEKTIKLSKEAMAEIYDAFIQFDFKGLKSLYEDPGVQGGDYVFIEATSNGKTHKVEVINMRVRDFDRITLRINSHLPRERTVLYNVFYGVKHRKEVKR